MNDFRLSVLKPRYEELFTNCQIRSSWLDRIRPQAEKIISLRSRYETVERATTVPWWFIGILHYRESTFRFDTHFHNGDPLSGRTIHVPAGRPEAPPTNGTRYTWEESAIDALRWKTYDSAKDRSIGAWLWRIELWNGFGYAMRGLNSEYLWNGTNHFGSGNNRGKFVADGKFDLNAESQQVGAATLFWYLYHKGIVKLGTASEVKAAEAVDATRMVTSTTTRPASGSIRLLDAVNYYQQLPHQDLAIAWFHQQQSAATLTEFARRWREEEPKPLISLTPLQSTPAPVETQQTGRKLRVLSDTVFKLSPQLSHTLAESEKVLIKAGTEFEVYADEPAPGNHVKVTFANALGPEGTTTWYVFSDHVVLNGTEPDNRPNERPDPDTIKISPIQTGPFQLPGSDSTFYLSHPILPNGHFSWAEATKNGTRIPISKSVVDGILKIAESMEEVRDYLGGYPITVNSWYRDPISNSQAGGASASRHLSGDAVDFVVQGISPAEVNRRLDPWWGSRGGIASASIFTHIDARGYKARWSYGF